MRVDTTQVAGARAGVAGRIHREFERCHLGFAAEVSGEQLVDGYIGKNLNLVSAPARRTGQKRSGCAGMNIVPARAKARQHEHLIPVRRQRFQNG